jgi:hypothetical protein
MTTADTERMLIESAMPAFDVVIAEHTIVDADQSTTFDAARTLDLLTVRTPLLAASIWIRALPARWVGRAAPPLPQLVVATGGLPGWLVLGERPSRENRVRRGRKVLAAGHRMARRAAERIRWFRGAWLGQDCR